MSDMLLDWESSTRGEDGGEVEEIPVSKFSPGNDEFTDNDRSELDQYVKEFQEKQKKKVSLREKNLSAATQRPDESFFSKLGSNLKKNTNFVRKLKTFSESQFESLLKDFETLNLTKYVAEIASNLCEAKLKMSDISAMVEFCSIMHQRYAEFASPNFMDAFKKSFPSPTKQKLADVDKSSPLTNPSKFRVDLRLLAELIVVGVLPEKEALNILGSTLKFLSSNPGGDYRHLPLIITFLKFCGDDYAGSIPRRVRIQCEKFHLPVDQIQSRFLAVERQKTVRSLFVDYYRELTEKFFSKTFRELKQIERQNRRQYETKGEIHPEAQQRLEEAKSSFEKLHQNVLQLGDLLDLDPPVLPEMPVVEEIEGQAGDAAGGSLIIGGCVFEKVDLGGGLFEDEDTRMFYETLPELRAMLPGILFKESEQATLAPVEEKINEVLEEEAQQQAGEETAANDGSAVQEKMDETPESEEVIPKDVETVDDEEEASASAIAAGGGASSSGGAVTGAIMKQLMDAFITQLPNTINRDLIDRAAIDFVTNLNTKPNRKRLVKTLFNVQRNRLDLLPFYGRLVAVLRPVMPDVSTELVRMLINDFRYQCKKKEQVHVESKIKAVRFIGELVKFKVFPKSEALLCLKMLLYDFRHHSIEMACALLDACGRFLYFSSDSHQKTKILLEQMERKRSAVTYLDQRYQLMIDNALATCKPELAVSQKEKVERPAWQEFMDKLIFKDLNRLTVEKVLKQLRKFNWDDVNVHSYAVSCLSQSWRVKFSCIQWMASLVAGLMHYYDSIAYQVIDTILEELRLGMEVNHHKFNQRRLCCAKYLGELYNYRVVDSPIIFNTLYSLVTFGVSYDPNVPGPLDPPEHLFRIRIACMLLETCGEYFNRGLAKKKLDCFLTYLQRYYWWKKRASCWSAEEFPFPLEIDNLLKDTFEFLRSGIKLFKNYEEADKAVKQIESEYREAAESALKFVQASDHQRQGPIDDDWEDERESTLRPIAEGDEEDVRISESEGSRGASQSQGAFGATGSLSSQGAAADWRGRSGDRDSDEDNAVRDKTAAEDDQCRVYRAGAVVDPEDEEFTAAFDRLMAESIQQRMQETNKPAAVEIPLPANVKTKLTVRAHFEDQDEPQEKAKEEGEYVNFVLLTKSKGGGAAKQALKSIKVPVTSDLACSLKNREQEEQKEKERMKQLTLNITRRMQQEEELAEIADLQKKVTENLAPRPYGKVQQQPQQQRGATGSGGFQHQRGAPGPHEAFSKSWQRH